MFTQYTRDLHDRCQRAGDASAADELDLLLQVKTQINEMIDLVRLAHMNKALRADKIQQSRIRLRGEEAARLIEMSAADLIHQNIEQIKERRGYVTSLLKQFDAKVARAGAA